MRTLSSAGQPDESGLSPWRTRPRAAPDDHESLFKTRPRGVQPRIDEQCGTLEQPLSLGFSACRGCIGSGDPAALAAKTLSSWKFVGDGRGAYERVTQYHYVGEGVGCFEKHEADDLRHRGFGACCSGLVFAALAMLLLRLLVTEYAEVRLRINDFFVSNRQPALTRPSVSSESAEGRDRALSPPHGLEELFDCEVEDMQQWSFDKKVWCCLQRDHRRCRSTEPSGRAGADAPPAERAATSSADYRSLADTSATGAPATVRGGARSRAVTPSFVAPRHASRQAKGAVEEKTA